MPDDDGDPVPTGELFRPAWLDPDAPAIERPASQAVGLEPWMDQAWHALEDAALAESLAITHEGRTLCWTHPSLAQVCFVASIEAIGGRSGLERCATCGLITGSTERFRQALRRVILREDAARLARLVYPRRSRTVHDGVLHGAEDEFGHFLRGRPWTNPGLRGDQDAVRAVTGQPGPAPRRAHPRPTRW